MAVSGEPSAPASMAPMPMSASGPSGMWSRCAESAPSDAPIMSSGASTPPEVPEPREKAHISDLKTMTPKTSPSVARPASRMAILS